MANYAQTSKNFTGQYMSGIQGINTGIIIPWGSTSVPSGFLECNGASVSTTTYAALFAVIGYTYGGSGANFNLPDLQDKTVLSRSNTKSLASTMGANTVAKSGTVGGSSGCTALTTAQIPAHAHYGSMQRPGYFVGNPCAPAPSGGNMMAATTGSTGGGGGHSHNLSATFTGNATSVLQPYLTLMYIIKT